MRIGIIAREFPPTFGGMPALAFALANELSLTDDVSVFTQAWLGVKDAPFRQHRILHGALPHDLRELKKHSVDVWLALNAGYTAIAPAMSEPFFAYFHGNDFLRPYVGRRRRWLNAIGKVSSCRRIRRIVEQGIRRRDIRRGLLHTEGLFTNSRNTARLIAESYGREAQLAHPGVDCRFFNHRSLVADDKYQFLSVARLRRGNERKNIDGTIRALAELNGEIEFRYTVIGDGDDRPRLEAIAGELGIADRVTFAAAVGDDELIRFYRRSDLFVLASRALPTDIEGFGIVYLEANACGVPVMCCRGGATDAVVDGINGIVLDDADSATIAAGIRRFVLERSSFDENRVRDSARRFRWSDTAAIIRAELITAVHSRSRPRCTGSVTEN